jgi:cytoskeletal protein RodZ
MKIFLTFFLITLLFNGCKTNKNTSQNVNKKENEKLTKFLQKSESELKTVMGEPNEITIDEKGSKFFTYTKKKYNITCERKFEINKDQTIIGFSSKGCF